ncbi:MAG: hypothetical protein ABI612_26720, partial [Betaproteobacteria bacterium]
MGDTRGLRIGCPPRLARPVDVALLSLVLVILPATPQLVAAQGGPPMLTDDPGTPGAGNWEINTAYTELRANEEHLRSFPHVDFNYGLGERIQIKYETGWVFADATDGVKSGLDNSLLGLKWRFLDQERAGLNMSVYPQLQAENNTSSVARGLTQPGPNLFLPVELSHEFGKLTVVGEVGYQYFRTEDDGWVVGVLGAVQATDALELMAEVRSFSPKFLNRGDVVFNVGLRQTL